MESSQGEISAPRDRIVLVSICWMLVSCLMFATVMAGIRMFLVDLPPEQTVFLRYLVGAGLMLPLVASRLPALASTKHKGKLVLRCLLHGLGVYTWFYAVLKVPLADVNALLNLGPIYATLGAVILFGEKLKLRRILAIVISFAGALIVNKPGFSDFTMGTLAILMAAPLFAFSDLIAKGLKAYHDDHLIIFSLSIGISALLLIPALYAWTPLNGSQWFGVMVIAVCATIGHVTLMKAFRGPMWAAQSGKYIQLVFVTSYGFFLFAEIPAISTIAGALIVCGAVSYIAFRESQLRTPKPPIHPVA
ncbi:MAG: DMT family transporter [Alphaproteobacteria bacterium]